MSLPKPKNDVYIGLLLMIIKVSFSESRILPYNDTLDTMLSFGAAGILALHIIQQTFSRKRLIIYGGIAIAALYSTMMTHQYGFLITIVTILAISDEQIDEIVNFIFKYELLFFVLHTFLAIIYGFVSTYSLFIVMDGITRYRFGFVHPNTFSAYLFNLIIMWVWLNYHRITKNNIASIALIGVFFYMFTKTRTFLFDVIIVLLLLLASKNEEMKLQKWIAMYIVPILSSISFFLVNLYTTGNSLILIIDDWLSARIKLGSYGYVNFGISLLGQDIHDFNMVWDSYWRLNKFTFDCTYTALLVMQGLIWLILIAVSFWLLSKKSSNRINFSIIVWSLYAITEVHGINGFKCFPIFLIALLLKNI